VDDAADALGHEVSTTALESLQDSTSPDQGTSVAALVSLDAFLDCSCGAGPHMPLGFACTFFRQVTKKTVGGEEQDGHGICQCRGNQERGEEAAEQAAATPCSR
jgi:hypothetical protein